MDAMAALASAIGCCRGCCGRACEKCMALKAHELTFDVGLAPTSYPDSYAAEAEEICCKPSVAVTTLTINDDEPHIPLGKRMSQDANGRFEGTLPSWTLVTTARDAMDPRPESGSCPEKCPICFEPMRPDTAVTFRCRRHPLCQDCCTNYFRTKLDEQTLPTCPVDKCGAEACPRLAELMLNAREMQDYLPTAMKAARRLHTCPKCKKTLYVAETAVPNCGTVSAVEGSVGTALAPENRAGGCSSSSSSSASSGTAVIDEHRQQQPGESQLWQEEERAEEEAPKPVEPSTLVEPPVVVEPPRPKPGLKHAVKCPGPDCQHEFCTRCFLPAHVGLFCDEARLKSGAPEAVLTLSLKGEDVRLCPSCNAACEKQSEDDCDHVTCAFCQFEFCYICRVDRKVIYAHGNHYHLKTCRHYFPFEEHDYRPSCYKCRERGSACIPVDYVPKKKMWW